MARSAIKLEEEENRIFHANYSYMWKKLNTAPYYVSGTGEMPRWIHEQWLLPSYVNLSKCLNPSFVPSMNIVNKITQFYNANIKPEVDTYTFLHEELEKSDHIRTTGSGTSAAAYSGLYYAYYYAGMQDQKMLYGALMKINGANDAASVQMITGLSCNEDLTSTQLRDLFRGNDIDPEKYQAFRSMLPLARRRTALYKGSVSLIPGVIGMDMHCIDHEGNILSFRVPAITDMDDQYFGSVGMLIMLNKQSIQILKLGIVRADQKDIKPLKLENETAMHILAIEKTENEHVHLNFEDHAHWNDLILTEQR